MKNNGALVTMLPILFVSLPKFPEVGMDAATGSDIVDPDLDTI